jgi:hypothetical protein
MHEIDSNISLLKAVNWPEELARVSMSGDERVLWIMVDKDTGGIKKISKHLYNIKNAIIGHLCVKGRLLERHFTLQLSNESQEEWPEKVVGIVRESLSAFGSLELS